jgi:hypothetical protein
MESLHILLSRQIMSRSTMILLSFEKVKEDESLAIRDPFCNDKTK